MPGTKDILVVKGMENDSLILYSELGGNGDKKSIEKRASEQSSSIYYSPVEVESKCRISFDLGQICYLNLC